MRRAKRMKAALAVRPIAIKADRAITTNTAIMIIVDHTKAVVRMTVIQPMFILPVSIKTAHATTTNTCIRPICIATIPISASNASRRNVPAAKYNAPKASIVSSRGDVLAMNRAQRRSLG